MIIRFAVLAIALEPQFGSSFLSLPVVPVGTSVGRSRRNLSFLSSCALSSGGAGLGISSGEEDWAAKGLASRVNQPQIDNFRADGFVVLRRAVSVDSLRGLVVLTIPSPCRPDHPLSSVHFAGCKSCCRPRLCPSRRGTLSCHCRSATAPSDESLPESRSGVQRACFSTPLRSSSLMTAPRRALRRTAQCLWRSRISTTARRRRCRLPRGCPFRRTCRRETAWSFRAQHRWTFRQRCAHLQRQAACLEALWKNAHRTSALLRRPCLPGAARCCTVG